jgi:hypothetical protein
LRLTRSIFAAATLLVFASTAHAFSIATADENGGDHKDFCPPLEHALKKAGFTYNCMQTGGSQANVARVSSSPRDIGFTQLDVYAREMRKPHAKPMTLLRTDLGNECLFLVTRTKSLRTYGEVAARAKSLRFVLPPKDSGSAATFDFLRKIDPHGLGKVKTKSITYAASVDAALDETLAAEDDNTVTLFVQFPDPGNARFKTINTKDGAFIPVISRAILDQEVDGQKIYVAQETQIANPKFLKKGETAVTACTPLALFTRAPSSLRKLRNVRRPNFIRLRHAAMVQAVRKFDRDRLVPASSFLDALWKNTKVLSRSAVEELVAISEKVRGEPAAAAVPEAKDAAVKPAEEKKKK